MFPNVFAQEGIDAPASEALDPILSFEQIQLIFVGSNPARIRLLTGTDDDLERLPCGNVADVKHDYFNSIKVHMVITSIP